MEKSVSKQSLVSAGTALCVLAVSSFVSFAVLGYLSGIALAVAGVICAAAAGVGIFLIIRSKNAAPGIKLTQREMTQRLAVTAVLLACVAVTKLFRLEIPMFGGAGMTVGLSGIFTAFPAILFGPLWGAAASACSDILGCIISPIGAYNPLFTITAFAGGFIKGCIWAALRNRKPASLRLVALIAGTAALLTGVAFRISLTYDGYLGSYLASASDMPSYGVSQSSEKTPFTAFAVSLASYNKDSYTLASAADAETVTVPSSVVTDGVAYTPKIGKNAFSGCASLKDVYIPSNIKTVAATAFDGLSGVTVHCEKANSALFADMSVTVSVEDSVEKTQKEAAYGGETVEAGEFTFTVVRNNASYLAKYINMLTAGLELTGAALLIILLCERIYSLIREKRGKTRRSGEYGFRVFASVFTAGFITTTLNTEILRFITYPTWAGRAFYVVWIPRVAEELIVCIIQAYLITVLYDVYVSRIAKKSVQ